MWCTLYNHPFTDEFMNTGELHMYGGVVSGLYRYPVKSMGGVRTNFLEIDLRGPRFDRRWMVCRSNGDFVTMREFPKLATITVSSFDGGISLFAQRMRPLIVVDKGDGFELRGKVWKTNDIPLIDQGARASEWVSRFIGNGEEFRLVRMADYAVRQVSQQWALRSTDQVALADGYPFLLISEGSLELLNQKLAERGKSNVEMYQFRPNIVVSGVEAHAEDTWKTVQIGEVIFDVVKPCVRCVAVTVQIDFQTGEVVSGKEPLATLARYRTAKTLGYEDLDGVLFGQNLVHRSQGLISTDDVVTVLEYR